MLRRTLLATLAAGAVATALPGAASASVTYMLTDQVYGYTGRQPDRQFISFLFTVSDEAVAQGDLSVAFRGGGGYTLFSGDAADFERLSVFRQTITPADRTQVGTFSLDVSFSGTDIAALSLSFLGETEDLNLTSTGTNRVSGLYGSDYNNCTTYYTGPDANTCTVSGRMALLGGAVPAGVGLPVPEPLSAALLGAGLLAAAAVRRLPRPAPA